VTSETERQEQIGRLEVEIQTLNRQLDAQAAAIGRVVLALFQENRIPIEELAAPCQELAEMERRLNALNQALEHLKQAPEIEGNCANCGAELPARARFCLECGVAVAIGTARPNEEVPAEAKTVLLEEAATNKLKTEAAEIPSGRSATQDDATLILPAAGGTETTKLLGSEADDERLPRPEWGATQSGIPTQIEPAASEVETPGRHKTGMEPTLILSETGTVAETGRACSQCGASLQPESRFCPECGKAAPRQTEGRTCSSCGATIHSEGRFCPACGEPASF
jgi:uncharacterized OB-fold protein